jgi:hypothetical protein
MLSCRFSHNVSLWASGREFWLAGVTDGNRITDIFRLPYVATDIIGLVNVDEGVVHILTADRIVYQLGGNLDPMKSQLQRIGHLP